MDLAAEAGEVEQGAEQLGGDGGRERDPAEVVREAGQRRSTQLLRLVVQQRQGVELEPLARLLKQRAQHTVCGRQQINNKFSFKITLIIICQFNI